MHRYGEFWVGPAPPQHPEGYAVCTPRPSELEVAIFGNQGLGGVDIRLVRNVDLDC